MTRNVLNAGQCGPDHTRIALMLKENFDVDVYCVETHEETVAKASESSYDLVLLNRIYDATGTEGLETLRILKSNDTTSNFPVMLVSNFDEAQQAAVTAGAVLDLFTGIHA